MSKPLTKAEIIGKLSTKTSLTKKTVSGVLENLTVLAYKEIKNDFNIPGIGKLVVGKRKARIGRNPQTGKAIKIPAKRVVKFRVAKACKDAVVGKK